MEHSFCELCFQRGIIVETKDGLTTTIDDLCVGKAENRFDAWCRKRLYPTLAAANAMEFETNQTIYKNRLDELCAGKPENEFDAWLRDRFYPIVAMMS